MPAAEQTRWEELGLREDILANIRKVGFAFPSDIQRALIPVAVTGRDCMGQARTGTGKTAAFTLPILQRIEPGAGLQALILVPTRELCVQVDEHVRALAGREVKTVVILGGRGLREQIQALHQRPEIAIGTPGRVLDLMRRNELKLNVIRVAVLDEVDRMLDIGFRDDIRRILRVIEHPHQTIFVSATIDDEIQKLARTFMTDPETVNVSRDMITVEGIAQSFVSVHPEDKFATLVGLIKHEAPTLAIVFTNTKHKARRVAQNLKREGIDCREIHGDLVQERRERVMRAFRKQQTQVLVATDLASRGIDVTNISHIVNYDLPEDPSIYVHRVGRTGRMGRTGIAISFVTREEGRLLTEVEKLINKELPQYHPPWLIAREPTAEEIAAAQVTAAAAKAQEDPSGAPARLREARVRSEVLDELGLRPVRRTLGSRFRTARQYRK
ncbi:MAG: DEAD/DEAH box helicase [Phycisphaerales bacterium]|nr:DEAD/DEAH box helicase [Phycisphaerales bacterium]